MRSTSVKQSTGRTGLLGNLAVCLGAIVVTLLVIALNTASGFTGYVGHVEIPWHFVAGFTGISVQGRSGRSTRIEVDGVDISDETVGTTTLNLSEDSIQEFQVAQSTLDPATSLTSTGAVNVITRSGSNSLHGSAFYLFRNDATAAKVGPVETLATFPYGDESAARQFARPVAWL